MPLQWSYLAAATPEVNAPSTDASTSLTERCMVLHDIVSSDCGAAVPMATHHTDTLTSHKFKQPLHINAHCTAIPACHSDKHRDAARASAPFAGRSQSLHRLPNAVRTGVEHGERAPIHRADTLARKRRHHRLVPKHRVHIARRIPAHPSNKSINTPPLWHLQQ